MWKIIKEYKIVVSFLVFVFILSIALQKVDEKIDQNKTIYDKSNSISFEGNILNSSKILDSRDLAGQKYILNIFASWCYPCAVEIEHLQKLKEKNIKIIGIAWRDNPDSLVRWLAKNGNPYETIIMDNTGQIIIDLGIKNIPNSFIIDNNNIIKIHKGPIMEENIAEIIEMF